MSKVAIKIDLDEIISQLSDKGKIELIKKLGKAPINRKVDKLLQQIDNRVKKSPITEKEIRQMVKESRKKIYG